MGTVPDSPRPRVPDCSPPVLPGRAKPELPECAAAAVPHGAEGGLPEVDHQPERHHLPDPLQPPPAHRCCCLSSSEPEQPPGDPGDPGEFKQGCSDPAAAACGRQEGAGEEETGTAPAAAAVSEPVKQRLKPRLNLRHRPRSHPLSGRAAEGAVQPRRWIDNRILIQSKLSKRTAVFHFFLIPIVINSCNLLKPFNNTFKSSNIFENIG